MCLVRKKMLVMLTLFFFITTVCSTPVLAQQHWMAFPTLSQDGTKTIPVAYVTPEQLAEIIQESKNLGYSIQQGSWHQLAELEQGKQPNLAATTEVQNCENQKVLAGENTNKGSKNKCVSTEENIDSQDTPSSQESLPPVETLPPPQPVPEPTVQANVGIYADVSYGGGNHGDAGKLFFIVAGVMVIAAFIVYAGKYISDIASGKDVKLWWEFIFSNDFLSAGSGQHGRLNGVKIATGFVSSDLIQVAPLVEIGKTDIDLVIDEDINSVPLDFSATYWLVGASARLHLTDKLVNASYLYLDFMGGQTSHGFTDTIGIARLGISFGIKDNVRLGGSLGAFYLDLDEDQGFVNESDNYWTTIGIEVGAKF